MIAKIGNLSLKVESVDEVHDLARSLQYVSVRMTGEVDVDRIVSELAQDTQGKLDVIEDNGTVVKSFTGLKPDRITTSYYAGGKMYNINFTF